MGCSSGKSAETKIDEKLKKDDINQEKLKKSDTSQSNNKNSVPQNSATTKTYVGEEKESYKKKYKVVQKIGSGSFGKVYKVIHLITNQIRAMKLINKETILYQDDEKKFLKEIEILCKLDHPHIIKIFEYYEDESYYYIVTELCEGGELFEQIVKNQSFNESDASIIMKQLFSAVFYMHSKGILHRDLKPENILLESKSGEMFIKIIDFGTSNYFQNNTKFKLKIGTPYYIAPEVIKQNYTNKCDLWSCGVILYILLSGTAPFNGSTDEEIMENVSSGKYDFEDDIWEDVSSEAKNLINKLLTYDPEKRINAEEAIQDVWIEKNYKKYEKGDKGDKDNYQISLSNLRNFAAKQKFQQATLAYLVHQVSSSDMIKDLRKIFKEFDKNGDGQLTYSELKEGFKKYFKNDNWADKEFDIIVKSFDFDNNKIIEYEEFLRVTINPDNLINDKNLEMAFDFFDKDKSGKLSPDEVRAALGIGSNKKDNELIKEIIAEVDLNNDGLISFDEFKHLMVKICSNK